MTKQADWEVEVEVGQWPDVLGLLRASSRGEFFVCSAPPAPVGTQVQVSLTLPDNSQVDLTGEVIRATNGSALVDNPAGFTITLAGRQRSDLVLLEAMASANCDVDPEDLDLQQLTIGARVLHRGKSTSPRSQPAIEPDAVFHGDDLSVDEPYDDSSETVTAWPPPQPPPPPPKKKFG